MKPTAYRPTPMTVCLLLGALASWALPQDSRGNDKGAEAKAYPAIGKIERLDPALDKLVPPDAKIEKLAEGFEWAEGPVWVTPAARVAKRKAGADAERGFLIFSDVITNTVHRWDERNGLGVFLRPSGYTGSTPRGGEPGSNGLTLDAKGRLVLCQHGDRRVARLKKDGTFKTLADRFEGKRFNSPNDLCFDAKGNLYFTDPPYGLEKRFEDPARELPFTGVYRLSTDGRLTLLTKEMTAPNGLAFSPDQRTLYVANSDPNRAIWMAFEVKDDGSVGNGRVFFDATPLREGRKGLPDGMKVDVHGNLFATGPGGVLVLSPDGRHLGTLNPGEATANCGFGGPDGSTLFLTSDMYLCRVRLSTRGNLPGTQAQGAAGGTTGR